MDSVRTSEGFFVRLDQGEELVQSLATFAGNNAFDFYAIAAAVGMIEGLQLGFYCSNNKDYDVYTIPGVLDLSSLSGNIAIRDDVWWPHIHIVANKPDFTTISGHVIKAKAHITMEIFVLCATKTNIKRNSASGVPAPILTW
jgi:uncharacterized protein